MQLKAILPKLVKLSDFSKKKNRSQLGHFVRHFWRTRFKQKKSDVSRSYVRER